MANKLRQSSSFKYWCRFGTTAQESWDFKGKEAAVLLEIEKSRTHPPLSFVRRAFETALGAAMNPD